MQVEGQKVPSPQGEKMSRFTTTTVKIQLTNIGDFLSIDVEMTAITERDDVYFWETRDDEGVITSHQTGRDGRAVWEEARDQDNSVFLIQLYGTANFVVVGTGHDEWLALARLSPLICDHINLLGRYRFSTNDLPKEGLRPLRNPLLPALQNL